LTKISSIESHASVCIYLHQYPLYFIFENFMNFFEKKKVSELLIINFCYTKSEVCCWVFLDDTPGPDDCDFKLLWFGLLLPGLWLVLLLLLLELFWLFSPSFRSFDLEVFFKVSFSLSLSLSFKELELSESKEGMELPRFYNIVNHFFFFILWKFETKKICFLTSEFRIFGGCAQCWVLRKSLFRKKKNFKKNSKKNSTMIYLP